MYASNTHLEPLGVLLLERGAVEELVGRLGVGEVEADPADALVAAAAEPQPGNRLALKRSVQCSCSGWQTENGKKLNNS